MHLNQVEKTALFYSGMMGCAPHGYVEHARIESYLPEMELRCISVIELDNGRIFHFEDNSSLVWVGSLVYAYKNKSFSDCELAYISGKGAVCLVNEVMLNAFLRSCEKQKAILLPAMPLACHPIVMNLGCCSV